MKVTERPLIDFVDLVSNKQPFAFSRWGDGEWKSVTGRTRGANCDGHQYFKGLGQDLGQVLKSKPKYLVGMQPLAVKVLGGKITTWLVKNKLDLPWINADVFHRASLEDKLSPLINALNSAPKLIVVGPPHLSKIKPLLDYHHFVTVPPRNAYLSWTEVLKEILSFSENGPAGTTISISAGMPAKLLVNALYKRPGQRHCIIDFGSVWDVYVGVRSRRYMQDMKVEVRDEQKV